MKPIFSRQWQLAIALPLLLGPAWAQEFRGKVVRIIDGDTIEVLRNSRAARIRLAEIDAPERTQAFGTRARQFTASLAFGQVVCVSPRDVDRYGRVVGEVILPDGRSLNRELVRAGFAWRYAEYSRSAELARLEAEARSGRRGLWADRRAIPPWEFRKLRGRNRSSRVFHFVD